MLKIVFEDDVYKPVVTCDVCHQRITEGVRANVTWVVPEDGHLPQTGEPIFLHKDCDHAVGNKPLDGSGWACWMDMRDFLVYLAHNLNLVYLAHNLNVDVEARRKKRAES